MVNWNDVLSATPTAQSVVTSFVAGNVSGTQLQKTFSGTPVSGQVRTLLRPRGVVAVRRAAREALRRRGVVVS